MSRIAQRLRALESRVDLSGDVQFVRVTQRIEPAEKGTDPATWPAVTRVHVSRHGVELTDDELEDLAGGATPEVSAWIDGLSDDDLVRVCMGELTMPIDPASEDHDGHV